MITIIIRKQMTQITQACLLGKQTVCACVCVHVRVTVGRRYRRSESEKDEQNKTEHAARRSWAATLCLVVSTVGHFPPLPVTEIWLPDSTREFSADESEFLIFSVLEQEINQIPHWSRDERVCRHRGVRALPDVHPHLLSVQLPHLQQQVSDSGIIYNSSAANATIWTSHISVLLHM